MRLKHSDLREHTLERDVYARRDVAEQGAQADFCSFAVDVDRLDLRGRLHEPFGAGRLQGQLHLLHEGANRQLLALEFVAGRRPTLSHKRANMLLRSGDGRSNTRECGPSGPGTDR